MDSVLVYRTPVWKELLSLALLLGLGSLGAFLVQLSDEEGKGVLVFGILFLIIAIAGAIAEISSRFILKLDATGICVQPFIFSRKRRIPWANIVEFDRAIQAVQMRGYSDAVHYTYLVIRTMKLPETVGSLVSETLNDAFKADVKMDIPRQAGDILIPAMRLPGNVDDILQEVRAYHARVMGRPIAISPSRPRVKKKYVTLWLLAVGAIIFVSVFLLTTITGKPVVEAGADIVLFFENNF